MTEPNEDETLVSLLVQKLVHFAEFSHAMTAQSLLEEVKQSDWLAKRDASRIAYGLRQAVVVASEGGRESEPLNAARQRLWKLQEHYLALSPQDFRSDWAEVQIFSLPKGLGAVVSARYQGESKNRLAVLTEDGWKVTPFSGSMSEEAFLTDSSWSDHEVLSTGFYPLDPEPWVWLNQRFSSGDPAGQDFDFDPTWAPRARYSQNQEDYS